MKKYNFEFGLIKNKLAGTNKRLRKSILQPLPYWIASLLTGLVAVFYTRIYGWCEHLSFYVLSLNPWLLFLVTPVCFLVSWFIVKRFAEYAKGSGIPQVMAAIEFATPKYNRRVDKLLSMRVLIVKIISSLLLIAGGGAIGREGPTIQIAGCIFRKVNQMIPRSWPRISKKNMIMTGAAAGLAAAFNTPLGGIVFAVEELTKTHINYFKIAILSSVIIAGLTAQGILGPYLYLGYPDVGSLSNFVFLAVLIVALAAGLMGSIMGKIMWMVLQWKSTFKKRSYEIWYVLICALLMCLIAVFFNKSILGSGKTEMSSLLFTHQKYFGWEMPLLRIAGPLLSFMNGSAGGVFAPSLSAGACIGSLIAHWFHTSETNSNLLILTGMVAFLTGVTRSPFTSAILVLEMTDRHSVVFHLMMAGILAALIANLIDRRSLYDHLKYRYMRELQEEENDKNDESEPKPVVST